MNKYISLLKSIAANLICCLSLTTVAFGSDPVENNGTEVYDFQRQSFFGRLNLELIPEVLGKMDVRAIIALACSCRFTSIEVNQYIKVKFERFCREYNLPRVAILDDSVDPHYPLKVLYILERYQKPRCPTDIYYIGLDIEYADHRVLCTEYRNRCSVWGRYFVLTKSPIIGAVITGINPRLFNYRKHDYYGLKKALEALGTSDNLVDIIGIVKAIDRDNAFFTNMSADDIVRILAALAAHKADEIRKIVQAINDQCGLILIDDLHEQGPIKLNKVNIAANLAAHKADEIREIVQTINDESDKSVAFLYEGMDDIDKELIKVRLAAHKAHEIREIVQAIIDESGAIFDDGMDGKNKIKVRLAAHKADEIREIVKAINAEGVAILYDKMDKQYKRDKRCISLIKSALAVYKAHEIREIVQAINENYYTLNLENLTPFQLFNIISLKAEQIRALATKPLAEIICKLGSDSNLLKFLNHLTICGGGQIKAFLEQFDAYNPGDLEPKDRIKIVSGIHNLSEEQIEYLAGKISLFLNEDMSPGMKANLILSLIHLQKNKLDVLEENIKKNKDIFKGQALFIDEVINFMERFDEEQLRALVENYKLIFDKEYSKNEVSFILARISTCSAYQIRTMATNEHFFKSATNIADKIHLIEALTSFGDDRFRKLIANLDVFLSTDMSNVRRFRTIFLMNILNPVELVKIANLLISFSDDDLQEFYEYVQDCNENQWEAVKAYFDFFFFEGMSAEKAINNVMNITTLTEDELEMIGQIYNS